MRRARAVAKLAESFKKTAPAPTPHSKYPITLRQLVDGVQKRTASATIEFALSEDPQGPAELKNMLQAARRS